jgi:PKD repeat protein
MLAIGVVLCALGSPGIALGQEVSPQAPIASFEMSKTVAKVGDTVTFTDTSVDPDGRIVRREWDINGDGVATDPDGARVVSRTYRTAGTIAIFVRVTDDGGHTSQMTRTLTIGDATGAPAPAPSGAPAPAPSGAPAPAPSGAPAPTPSANRAPVASFSFTPQTAAPRQPVSFSSTATDADGSIASQLWDLDGDGQFDDAGGPTAQFGYPTSGPRVVSLMVTDDRGASSVAFQTVNVSSEGAPAPATTSRSAVLMSPFPVVRLRGRILRRSVRVELLSVQAPLGARISVRCTGHGCPFRVAVRRSRSGHRVVRFRELNHLLRAGTVIQIMVTKPGRIGKYTRFTIRSGAPPMRRDRCLAPGGSRPTACPAQ